MTATGLDPQSLTTTHNPQNHQTRIHNPKLTFTPASSEEFLDIQAVIECGLTLKLVRDMRRTYHQMHRTDKYLQHSSIIWPFLLNSLVFLYELSGCGLESSCNHLKYKFLAYFEQGVPWQSGNYRVWIHSETWMWHNKNIQFNTKLIVIHAQLLKMLLIKQLHSLFH